MSARESAAPAEARASYRLTPSDTRACSVPAAAMLGRDEICRLRPSRVATASNRPSLASGCMQSRVICTRRRCCPVVRAWRTRSGSRRNTAGDRQSTARHRAIRLQRHTGSCLAILWRAHAPRPGVRGRGAMSGVLMPHISRAPAVAREFPKLRAISKNRPAQAKSDAPVNRARAQWFQSASERS
jgi:hypothetical protein